MTQEWERDVAGRLGALEANTANLSRQLIAMDLKLDGMAHSHTPQKEHAYALAGGGIGAGLMGGIGAILKVLGLW